MTTWRERISAEMTEQGESWADVESIAGAKHLDVPFNDGYGWTSGEPFTVWTEKRVPDGIATSHVGG